MVGPEKQNIAHGKLYKKGKGKVQVSAYSVERLRNPLSKGGCGWEYFCILGIVSNFFVIFLF